jgi:hypothetical protein
MSLIVTILFVSNLLGQWVDTAAATETAQKPNHKSCSWEQMLPYLKAYLYVHQQNGKWVMHLCEGINLVNNKDNPDSTMRLIAFNSLRTFLFGVRDPKVWFTLPDSGDTDTLLEPYVDEKRAEEAADIYVSLVRKVMEPVKKNPSAFTQPVVQQKVWQAFFTDKRFVNRIQIILPEVARLYEYEYVATR